MSYVDVIGTVQGIDCMYLILYIYYYIFLCKCDVNIIY